jgi:hypothetical protein
MLRESFDAPASISQILTVKSPEADARTFSAAGLKTTCPTFLLLNQFGVSGRAQVVVARYLGCPLSLPIGAISCTFSGSASVLRENPSGTRHKNIYHRSAGLFLKGHGATERRTLPSSEPEASNESLKGFLFQLVSVCIQTDRHRALTSPYPGLQRCARERGGCARVICPAR